MRKIFLDHTKINLFALIQKKLLRLRPESSEKSINKIFNLFPPNFLDEKENLIMAIKLFVMIACCRIYMYKMVIKLLQKILHKMKIYLQDESSTI